MQDRYGRTVDCLRISVNRACNLRCFYCHNEGQLNGSRQMGPEEIERLIRVASELGITKVKVTGGEPLLRDDIIDIVGRIARHSKEVSLTTNGMLLAGLARGLRQAGLARVNISMDSIDPGTYKRICRSGNLDEVKDGIEAAISAGLGPVKLNMVVLRGVNDTEIPDMMAFAARKGVMLQLIEYEVSRDEADQGLFREHHFDLGHLEDHLQATAQKVGENPLHRRRRYRIDRLAGTADWPETVFDTPVDVELVRPMNNKDFCANCRRLRITSSGRIKGCLFQEEGVIDVLGPMRAGAGDDRLKALFAEAVRARRPYWVGDRAGCAPDMGQRARCDIG